MKKVIYIIIVLIFIVSCSTKKTGITNRTYHRMTSWYNTIFNGKETLLKELDAQKESYQDNFSTLLKVEPIDPFQEVDDFSDFDDLGIGYGPDIKSQVKKGDLQGAANSLLGSGQESQAKGLERVIEKGKLAIGKHSMLIKGKEHNSMIGEAYLLVGKAYYYNNNPLEALNYYNYMDASLVKNRKQNEMKIYMALAHAKADNSFQAEEIYEELKKIKLKKSDRKLASRAYSQFLIDEDRYEDAIEALEVAKKQNKDRYNIGRYNFIQGQLSEKLEKKEEAIVYFEQAFNKKPSPELEIKSQIELAKYFEGDSLQYNEKIKFLKKLLNKGLYQSRKNELLYAMGVTSLSVDKDEQAMDYLQRSLKEKESDPQIRALAYQKVGDLYFSKSDYVYAGAYYDSAVSRFTDPTLKSRLEIKNKTLKDVIQKYYLVKRNDSILSVVKMEPQQRQEYYLKHIEKLKKEEEIKRVELEKKIEQGGYNTSFQTEILSDQNEIASKPVSGQKWYFYNNSLKQKGQTDFKRLWGDRALVDNWRVSKQLSNLEDLKSELLGNEKVKDPRRFEVDYYTEKLPQSTEEIERLKMQRDSAELALGIMYYDKLEDIKSGTTSLKHLISTPPFDESLTLAALYNLYKFNREQNPQISKEYGDQILSKYPNTKYAEYVLNPDAEKAKIKVKSSEAITFYESTYKKYEEGKYTEAKNMIQQGLEKYPSDEIIAKLSLLSAFCEAKMGNKEEFLKQLEKVSISYDKTPEGEKAVEILAYFKQQEDLIQKESEEKEKIEVDKILEESQKSEIPSQEEFEKQEKILLKEKL